MGTLVGVFVGILWCVLHRKSLSLRGHFRGHLRVHSRGHFREHFRERVRGSNFAVRVLCAFLTLRDPLKDFPKGPKIEKNQSRLKISISIECFKLA